MRSSTGRCAIAGSSWRSASLMLGSTFIVNKYIGRDWMPQEDQNELWRLARTAGRLFARGNRETDARSRRDKLEKIPGVIAVIPSSSNGFIERVTMAQHHGAAEAAAIERDEIGVMGQKVRDDHPRLRFCPAADHVPERAGRTRHVRADSRSAAGSRHAPPGGVWPSRHQRRDDAGARRSPT